jgi:mono/diheme cytochrome c family protein
MMRMMLLVGALSLAACGGTVMQTRVTADQFGVVAHSAPPLSSGDSTAGREAFAKLRCNSCHSVAGEPPAARLPLRDLSRETPEAVANLIVSRSEMAPEALFDEMAMSAAASSMTPRELADLVTYLRNPAAAKR